MTDEINELIKVWPGNFQDLLMVYDGKKDVLFDGFRESDDEKLITRKLRDFGFEFLILKNDESSSDISIVVGNNRNICLEAKKAREEEDFYKLGLILGYPECCVKHHLGGTGDGKPLPREEYTIYTEGDNMELDYRINTLLNMESVGREGLEKVGIWRRDYLKNQYSYITHIPCSAECSQSFELAKRIRNVVKKYLPEENKKIEGKLRRVFIIFGFADYIMFDYKKSGDRVKVCNVTKSPITSRKKLEKIKRAEWVKLKRGNVVTSNNENLNCCRSIIFY